MVASPAYAATDLTGWGTAAGGGDIDSVETAIGLSRTDPRIIIARIINIALGFLGIIAVGLIIYAGWLWMTAGGEAQKIEKAKKILIGAVIGLLIILASFALVSFILSRLLDATGGGPGGPGGPGGAFGASAAPSAPLPARAPASSRNQR